jgi:hypothetical protein
MKASDMITARRKLSVTFQTLSKICRQVCVIDFDFDFDFDFDWVNGL